MKFIIVALLIIISVLFTGCKTYHDQIVLEDVDQEMSAQDEFREKELQERKIPPATGFIKEIEVYRGEQKYLYVAIGRNIKGIKSGLYGYIYNDSKKSNRIGMCKIVEVYSNICKARITELYYKVEYNAVIEVEVDPRYYIKP